MKLKIMGFDSIIDLEGSFISVIEIHNKKLFQKIISEIYDRIKGVEEKSELIIYNQLDEINYTKDIFFVDNLFSIDFNNRSIINKLYSEAIKNYTDYEMFNTLEKINFEILKLLNEVSNDIDVNIMYHNNIEFKDLLKFMNFKIDTPINTSMKENIFLLVDIMSEFKIYKFIILTNLKNYLDKNDIIEIYKYSEYKQINLILIESEKCEKIESETKLIIDEDFEDYIIK